MPYCAAGPSRPKHNVLVPQVFVTEDAHGRIKSTGMLYQMARGLVRRLGDALHAGDIALPDRGFCSYADIARLLHRGVQSLFRLQEEESTVNLGGGLDFTS